MTTSPPFTAVVPVKAGTRENRSRHSVEDLCELRESRLRWSPACRLALDPRLLSMSPLSSLSIVLSGKLRDQSIASILADNTRVHLAAAGVVPSIAAAHLPLHSVVLPLSVCPA